MSCLSIAGAYHLDFELPQWLSTASGGRLGPNPFMLLLLISIIGGAVIAAAVPLRESTVLLYNAATRQEVRLNEWQGYTREPSNVPGRSNGWVGVCAGGYATVPPELRAQRADRQHHGLFVAGVALFVAWKLRDVGALASTFSLLGGAGGAQPEGAGEATGAQAELPRETWDPRVG